MKTSITIGGYARNDIKGTVEFVRQAEKLGVERVWSAEAWGQDAVTSLAFLAAQTDRIGLGTGIMQISARVPSMIAMTSLSLQALSNGRFTLGLGASGPQVVEGLHGVAYDSPLTRLRETVEIIRMGFQGEKLSYQGKRHTLPRLGGEGKAIRLDFPATKIPIFLATLAPRSLEYTGASADGWLGTSFSPDHAETHLAHIRSGAERAGRSIKDIELNVTCPVSIGEDVEGMIEARRAGVAFNMGAMGSATTNFYNDAFRRAGFVNDAEEIQSLWLAGKREEATRRVPDAMVTQFGALGTSQMVSERFRLYRDVGIDSLTLRLDADGMNAKLEMLEHIVDLLRRLA
ncbi:MAG TPA: LLM class flavin-dependent oxidoreductase [Alphaproteobacteria bacterium]|nr:LLM class flavin-dependent oxidoreductase [Alphaproteobacteria bacterium]